MEFSINGKEMISWEKVNRFAEKGSPAPESKVNKSNEEWRRELTDEQYRVTRKRGTEKPWSGEYCEARQPGLYACVCCGTKLFDSRKKFESSSGWPSYTEPVKNNVVAYEQDFSHGMSRIEVLCNVCDAHLGHVFPDGPEPTGLRYCINSTALKLVEKAGDSVKSGK